MLLKKSFEFAYYLSLLTVNLLLLASIGRVVDGKQRKARITPATAESLVQFVEIQDCLSLPDGIYPDPTDCHRYYHCSRGKTYYFRCYDGFVFHPCALKCSFRDSCIAADSCNKTTKDDGSNVTTAITASPATSSTKSQRSSSSTITPKLLKLANSTPLFSNIVHSKGSTTERVVPTDNRNENSIQQHVERLGVDRNDPATAEHSDDTVGSKLKTGDAFETVSTTTATESSPAGTSDATMTYIVRVVFAKRTQQAGLDQTTPAIASTTSARSTAAETETTTVQSKSSTTETDKNNTTIITTEVNVNLTLKNETSNELITNSSFTDEEHFNISSTDSTLLNNSTANITLAEERVNSSSSSSTIDSFNSFTLSKNSSVSLDNDTTVTTTSDGLDNNNSTTVFNETSRSLAIAESNKIDDNAQPEKNFIKTEYVSTKTGGNETTTTTTTTTTTATTTSGKVLHDETTTAESSTTTESDSVANTTLSTTSATATEATTTTPTATTEQSTTGTTEGYTTTDIQLDNKTTVIDNRSNDSSTVDETVTTTGLNTTALDEDFKTTTSIVEDIGEHNGTSTTLNFDGRAREVISNITISCNPAISSAMCENFNNLSKESLVRRCQQLTCLNGGMFISLSNGHCGCVCPQGMRGDNCQHLVDKSVCNCANGGRCVQVGNDTYTCMCPLGLLGAQCQHTLADVRPKVSNLIQLPQGIVTDGQQQPLVDFSKYVMCSTNVCLNGGLCLQQVKPNAESRKCFCSDNFGGDFCEKSYS